MKILKGLGIAMCIATPLVLGCGGAKKDVEMPDKTPAAEADGTEEKKDGEKDGEKDADKGGEYNQ